MQQVADGLGAGPVGEKRAAEQEGDVHAGQTQLAAGAKPAGEDHGAQEASGQRSPDGHGADPSASVVAALISARWTSACGKLPRNSPRIGVDLLGVETEIVGQRKQLLHQRGRLLAAAAPRKCLDQPERAGHEAPFPAGEAVGAAVAVKERAARELLADGVDRRVHPRLIRRAKAHQRREQQACVQLADSGRAHVAVSLRRPAARVDELADLLGRCLPSVGVAVRQLALLRELGGAVEGHPAHQLRLGEVRRLGAHLPDPGVGPAPQPADLVRDLAQPAAGLAVEPPAARRVAVRGLEQLAVDVELQLRRGGIADPDRPRPAIAGERQLALGRARATVEAVEDPEPGMGQLRRVQQPREVGVGLRRTAEREEGVEREGGVPAATSSGSPSCARRRAPPAARSWRRRRSRRTGRRPGASAPRRCE